MSSIYISEPSTNGKVILKTTVGEIEIELWSKETPKACRNFVQLCMEGYYDDTPFHRLVKNFIVQGGDPTGTGNGGECIYEKPFKNEVHSRLAFNRRGLVGMASTGGRNDKVGGGGGNTSQFFFTLGPTPELTGKHTLFGRVVGETLFNMLRLGEGSVGSDERPERIHRIASTYVVLNPYDDIIPRQLPSRSKKTAPTGHEPKVTAKATKNFSLLSFGEEAEEEDGVTNQVSSTLRSKGKSAHDLLSDPRLSSVPVQVNSPDGLENVREAADKELEQRRKRRLAQDNDDPDSQTVKQQRIDALRLESNQLKRELAAAKRAERARREEEANAETSAVKQALEKEAEEQAALARLDQSATPLGKPAINPDDFSDELTAYRVRSKRSKANAEREAATLSMLDKFQSRLRSAISTGGAFASTNDEDNGDEAAGQGHEDKPPVNSVDDWMKNPLIAEEPGPARKVIDPSLPNPDRYDLYDPRNPLNVRKRGGGDAK